MTNLYIFLFDLDYGVEETYQEVVEAENIEAAWEKIKYDEDDPEDPTDPEDRMHDKEEVDQVIEIFRDTREWNHWAYNSKIDNWELGHWAGHIGGVNQPFHYRGKYKIR